MFIELVGLSVEELLSLVGEASAAMVRANLYEAKLALVFLTFFLKKICATLWVTTRYIHCQTEFGICSNVGTNSKVLTYGTGAVFFCVLF